MKESFFRLMKNIAFHVTAVLMISGLVLCLFWLVGFRGDKPEQQTPTTATSTVAVTVALERANGLTQFRTVTSEVEHLPRNPQEMEALMSSIAKVVESIAPNTFSTISIVNIYKY